MRSDESEGGSMKQRLRCIELITQFDDDTIQTVTLMLDRMAPASAKPRKRGPRRERTRTAAMEKETEA